MHTPKTFQALQKKRALIDRKTESFSTGKVCAFQTWTRALPVVKSARFWAYTYEWCALNDCDPCPVSYPHPPIQKKKKKFYKVSGGKTMWTERERERESRKNLNWCISLDNATTEWLISSYAVLKGYSPDRLGTCSNFVVDGFVWGLVFWVLVEMFF